jgi:CheY-like chemotaxis protein
MSALVTKDRPSSNEREWAEYHQFQPPRGIMERSDHPTEASMGERRKLLRVLIVDDYRTSADTMAKLVSIWGHDVRRTYDGTFGMALAAAYQPDVLLFDLNMSGVNGVELGRQLRRQARVNHCLLIATTGRTDAGHRLQCAEARFDLFLIKPVDLSFLRTLLGVESKYRSQSWRYAVPRHVHSTMLRRRMATAYSP